MSALRMIYADQLFENEATGLEKTPVEFDGAEVIAYRFAAGERVPLHTHSNATLKVILSGRMLVFDAAGQQIGDLRGGDMYVCPDEAPYEVQVVEETRMVLVQTPGTERVSA